jgi:hypothetical protein
LSICTEISLGQPILLARLVCAALRDGCLHLLQERVGVGRIRRLRTSARGRNTLLRCADLLPVMRGLSYGLLSVLRILRVDAAEDAIGLYSRYDVNVLGDRRLSPVGVGARACAGRFAAFDAHIDHESRLTFVGDGRMSERKRDRSGPEHRNEATGQSHVVLSPLAKEARV